MGCETGDAVGVDRMFGDAGGQSQMSSTKGRTMAAIAHTAINTKRPTMQRNLVCALFASSPVGPSGSSLIMVALKKTMKNPIKQ